MTKNTSLLQQALRGRARNRSQRGKLIPVIAVIIGGLILIISTWVLFSNRNHTKAALDYTPEDVVYDHPLHAVHEMGGPSLATIPFLPKSDPQPKIVIPEAFHNFGSVGAIEVVNKEFVIANTGEGPLTISRAYTTCGCTTADFSATVIPPGKVSIMTLAYDAGFHDAQGQTVRRGVIIENNDPSYPQMEIWVQASVRNAP